MQQCIAGCEKLEATGPDEYQSTVKVSIGPVSARFVSKLNLCDVQPPRQCTLKFSGQGGVAGFGKGETRMTLVPLADGATQLDWTVDAQVGGKLAQIGSRLVEGSVRKMSEDFFTRLRSVLEVVASEQSEAVSSDAVAPEAPKQVPTLDAQTRWLWAAAAVLTLLALGLAAGFVR